jgi:hypothetical protein
MYNEIFSGYQPRQMVKRRKIQRFKGHLFPRPQDTEDFSTLRMRTEMVLETLVSSPFNHLTRLMAREDFIIPVSRVGRLINLFPEVHDDDKN